MNLTLYYSDTCFFCHKVLNFLDQHSIDVPKRNTGIDGQARSDLLSLGGKTQVPCLDINGSALYESDDIIDWFKQNNLK
ncbi:glutaredoxin [Candidatus Marinamargulisbacteria bacterium SCGC AG-410-N11]|nr:glutaredoxin [Candidatus Marinamargulisbacteria bacterium SCGC AG-410-N11]